MSTVFLAQQKHNAIKESAKTYIVQSEQLIHLGTLATQWIRAKCANDVWRQVGSLVKTWVLFTRKMPAIKIWQHVNDMYVEKMTKFAVTCSRLFSAVSAQTASLSHEHSNNNVKEKKVITEHLEMET